PPRTRRRPRRRSPSSLASARSGVRSRRIPERIRSEMSDYEQPLVREGALRQPLEAADAKAVFGQVMGLVAVTVGFFALGAYIGRDITGGTSLVLFIGAFACAFGLNFAARCAE